MLRKQLITALVATVCLALLLGGVYPLVVTGIAQVAFPHRAGGSLVRDAHGRIVGSALVGQQFLTAGGAPDSRYFQPRPSAAGNGYDPTASSAANLGPTNPLLIGNVPGVNVVTNPSATPDDPYCVPLPAGGCNPATAPELAIAYRRFNDLAPGASVPVDAVTSSGSGLDPDISVSNALVQAGRVARVRGLDAGRVTALVHAHVATRPWGFLGEDAVNVLDLNVALDAMH